MTINFKKSILNNFFCILGVVHIIIRNFICPVTMFFIYTLKKVTVYKVKSGYNM